MCCRVCRARLQYGPAAAARATARPPTSDGHVGGGGVALLRLLVWECADSLGCRGRLFMHVTRRRNMDQKRRREQELPRAKLHSCQRLRHANTRTHAWCYGYLIHPVLSLSRSVALFYCSLGTIACMLYLRQCHQCRCLQARRRLRAINT